MKNWMSKALEEAAKGLGNTSPNPAVGAVIYKGGRTIARGYHRKFGDLHAEIEAIRSVPPAMFSDLKNCTMAVTLEPCDHFGKTPPCTQAILKSGIRHVVVGMLDPHPIVAGRGVRRLRRGGIRVDVLQDEETIRFYEPYALYHREGRPFVTLKIALSSDGKIAGKRPGWITGPAAREEVQRIRRKADAILVGRATAMLDNPRLTVRPPFLQGRQHGLTRVILTRSGRLDPRLRMFHDVTAPTIIFTGKTGNGRIDCVFAGQDVNARVIAVPESRRGLDLPAVLRNLAARGVMHLLVEGGAETANRFLEQRLVDEVVLFVSPRIVGPGGVDAFRPKPTLRNACVEWRLHRTQAFGRDLMLVFRESSRSRKRPGSATARARVGARASRRA